jgi:hypothetical protein
VRKFFLFLCGIVLSANVAAFANDPETIASLIEQLNGQRCDYEFLVTCQKRDIGLLENLGINTIRNKNEHCIMWSAQCLSFMKPPEAVPALITALKTQSNVQTCDGVIPLRDVIIQALVEIGDKRAVPPLEEYIKSDSYEKLSAGASGCTAKPESKQIAKEAIRVIQ